MWAPASRQHHNNCRMIPTWNSQGVLPPVRPGAVGSSTDRAPYRVTLENLINQLASSPARAKIMQGFLDHRAALHQVGILSGFQWVNGSYLEDIESLELRPPNDMDVITFYPFSVGRDEMMLLQRYPKIFDSQYSKGEYSVDAYFYPIGIENTQSTIRWITYWYSMWSHTRGTRGRSTRRRGASRDRFAHINLWKGFVEVDLSSDHDSDARSVLNSIVQQRGWR